MFARLTILAALVLLAACDKGEPTRVTINAGSNGTAPANKGTVQVGGDGFKADIEIPGLASLGGRMKMDGVRLYPDAKVTNINIDGDKGDKGRVAVSFTAPADRARVAAWYVEQMRDAEFKARETPTGFAGETKDGNWFTLDLKEAGAQTLGEFKLGEAQR
ncbi:hypothetical protein HJG53_08150 [Sphingomonas sp. ID1715]|uniref:hypothetical protein n=1 Tax=Sphingomonas sp. ID1715 TaxID=1656898 RepID=UPI0014878113|nr:hypothetical protein [Sphingomonas sp. ID1715]NNM76868.1 hypothetical protein [Sphingomonas sp. ID1715]